MPDGQWPYAGLIRDKVGNLYGTTQYGGTYNWGTLYKIDTTGKTSVLYDFKGGADGGEPSGLLVFDKSGNLYGTTVEYPYAYGNVFMLDKKGKETVLYSFTGPPDGAFPQGQLLWDSKGNLYGTTNNGGNQCGFPVISSCGTIYELTPNPTGGWTESVLYRFTGGADGGYPIAGLVQSTNGDFYGTTYWGGIPGCDLGFGCGVVFKLDTNLNESVLYSFTGQGDGANTGRSVLLDSTGNFYGTTVYGGPSNRGTVFKISPAGQETILYAFTGALDGSNPDSNLIEDASGNFYGTAINGGANGAGVVFEIPALSLSFPVKSDPACGTGSCSPTNAPITAVFDHNMAVPYECRSGFGGYGSMMAFTAEAAPDEYPESKGFGKCKKLFGYTNPNVSSFLAGYNYTGNRSVLYYDSHPGYDYGFGFGTALYPAINGCVTYLQNAAGVVAATGHVLAIIPQPTEPLGGCKGAAKTSPYDVIYMHLSSFYDPTTQQVLQCTTSGTICNSGQNIVPCPTCAQQDDWVSTNRANPIGYSGNFYGTSKNGWGGVAPHLHFEVDQVLKTNPRAVDPYGWCGVPDTDPYTGFTGLANTTFWGQFTLSCPTGEN